MNTLYPIVAVHEELDKIDLEREKIASLLDAYRYTDGAEVDWGHAGDLAHVLGELRTITRFLRGHQRRADAQTLP